jgi:plasmid maintenance system antidote protein VapI
LSAAGRGSYDPGVRFRDFLSSELERRRALNRRYSLRAYARALGVHHATVSRLLRGTGAIPSRSVRALGQRLGLAPRDLAAFLARENQEGVLAAIARPTFRPESRWLAATIGIPVDEINIALHALISGGRLRMTSSQRWTPAQEGLQP